MSNTREQRKQIAKTMLTAIKKRNGRFLKLNSDTYLVEELSQAKAMSKICHDLREDQRSTRQIVDQSSDPALKSFASFATDESMSL